MMSEQVLSHVFGGKLPAGIGAYEIPDMQNRLLALLERRTRRYTMGDSTSVRTGTAEELLRSICFSLALYHREHGPERFLRETDWNGILEASWSIIEGQLAEIKRLFFTVRTCAPAVTSLAWRDTVVSIGSSLKRYDYRFFAHEMPCSIDYQLAQPVPEALLGTEYITEYLSRLLTEGRFLRCFKAEELMLAARDVPDFDASLANLYDLAAHRALPLMLAGYSGASIALPDDMEQRLYSRYADTTKEELSILLQSAAASLCGTLKLSDPRDAEYLSLTAENIAPRLFESITHTSFRM